MQIETAAAIDLSKEKKQNESSFSDQMKAYMKHPGSGILALLTLLGAVLTFALLFFLIGYILVKGVPYLSTDLFSLTYNSDNLSLASITDQYLYPDSSISCDRSTSGNFCSDLSGRICEKRK